MMADILVDNFGKMLYTRDNDKLKCMWETFPSPGELRGKILLRDKGQAEADDDDPANTATGDVKMNKRQKKKMKKMEKKAGSEEDVDEDDDDSSTATASRSLEELIAIKNVKHHEAVGSTRAVSSSRGEAKLEEMHA